MDTKKTLDVLRSSLDVVLCCDPAISEKATADRTAIVVMGMAPHQAIFLLEYWVGRQGDPFKIIQTLLDLADFWQPRCIGIETVAYQKSLEPYTLKAMRDRGIWYPIVPLQPDRNEKKEQRILSLQPFFRAGQVYIQRGMHEFVEEYETFPLGRTRDILDAMAYAVRLLVPKQPSRKPTLVLQLQELAKSDPLSARYWRADAIKRGELEPEPSLDERLEDELADAEAGIGEFV